MCRALNKMRDACRNLEKNVLEKTSKKILPRFIPQVVWLTCAQNIREASVTGGEGRRKRMVENRDVQVSKG